MRNLDSFHIFIFCFLKFQRDKKYFETFKLDLEFELESKLTLEKETYVNNFNKMRDFEIQNNNDSKKLLESSEVLPNLSENEISDEELSQSGENDQDENSQNEINPELPKGSHGKQIVNYFARLLDFSKIFVR
jgi:hypothetical protein